MNEITEYGKVFDILVAKTKEYLISNNLKAEENANLLTELLG